MNLSGKLRELYVSRSRLHVGVAMRAFDSLISRAAVAADGSVDGHRDFIIDRNVTGRHLIDVDAVSILPYWRMLLNVGYVRVTVAKQPVVPNIYLGANGDRPRPTAVHNHVTGAGLYFQIQGPADLQGFLEMSLRCGSGRKNGSKQRGQPDHKK